jgi:hypothetical protein
MLGMEARSLAPSDPHQARPGLFGALRQTGGRSDTTAFPQRIDDLFRRGFGQLGSA